ncbi:MAG TPA: biotin carboxylase N-terminal domain-containing protein [Actinomycetota bacterium]|nr:biotin carboxylase N-terminal domain-containing protein [Actinomycetota bacterium]
MGKQRVLIANRGEIAVRVIRTCRELGLPTVAVYSDVDHDALHVELADRAYHIGPASPALSYLNVETILDVARRSGATMIHPGYGFLAENPDFARACAEAGLTFIGPPPEAMEMMGDKAAARRTAEQVGIPVIPGLSEPVGAAEALKVAERIGFPLAVKAAFGGGGRGLHLVPSAAELEDAVERSSREAKSYFGRPEVYLERYLASAHHVEAQILCDAHGNASFLGERDCSLQRRYQKLVEESPSPVVDDHLRSRIGEAALAIAGASGYRNAGTIEFLVEDDGSFYFLEMNTRLQVEHPVTEMVAGLDLVRMQIEVALGEKVAPSTPDLRGHAIECRINAEDPAADFLPRPGLVSRLRFPAGPFVRVDAGTTEGRTIPGDYDSLFAKLIVWGEDREAARRRMLRALDEFEVEGVPTTIPFHRWVLDTITFREGSHTTRWVERALEEGMFRPEMADGDPSSPPSPTGHLVVEVGGRRVPVKVWGEDLAAPPPAPESAAHAHHAGAPGAVVAPMQGTILKVLVEEGQEIEAGAVVCILEAMKMENHIAATQDGTVGSVDVSPGDVVQGGQTIATIG